MKILKSILILSLIVCVCVCVSHAQTRQLGEAEPYDIGVEKTIDVEGAFIIKYRNDTTGEKEVTLTGTIAVDKQFKIVQLDLDYYTFDRDRYAVHGIDVILIRDENEPGKFSFKHTYPLQLREAEYELFSLIFIVEQIETHNL